MNDDTLAREDGDVGIERNDPLRVLFDDDLDDPERVVLEGGERIDTDEFRAALLDLAEASRLVAKLADDIAALRETGLREDDIVALLWGRTTLNKSEVRAVLDALKDVGGNLDSTSGRRRLLKRLVADMSGEGIQTTKAVFAELDDLRDRYGGGRDG